ncbi:hypothetical protein EG352_03755 [Chryseobacterium indologenes]|uniref:Uncharacterized protein n=1 Tax=Chryseobacterium indologenes TaxID=253 RepID=A0AAD1DUC4_CHRID|nr:hypothetical protein [Chryseobacterium indologenes]ASE61277.1 hypothetical protein CEQ15_07090 [Chryseobacterium indologenes]AZB16949.1 hypothetical protein EG352_03755 [Chryseobacterium indologenes]
MYKIFTPEPPIYFGLSIHSISGSSSLLNMLTMSMMYWLPDTELFLSLPEINKMEEIKQYKAWAIKKDGTKQPIEAESIILQVGEEEIEISLVPPHPVFNGRLTLTTGSAIRGRESERGLGTQLIIEPGASNVLHISVKKNHV